MKERVEGLVPSGYVNRNMKLKKEKRRLLMRELSLSARWVVFVETNETEAIRLIVKWINS